MLPCKLCAPWRALLARRAEAWERANSNESELWSAESPGNRETIERAYALYEADPAGSVRLYLEAAEAGSPWALEEIARQYETGAVLPADPARAQLCYSRAISAGSQMATLAYARFLAGQGRHEECEAILEEGVRAGFVPAAFWLAWFRHARSRSRSTCRQIRPLLEEAASKGHPEARALLARLMILGRFGLREIPLGLRSAALLATESVRAAEEERGPDSPLSDDPDRLQPEPSR